MFTLRVLNTACCPPEPPSLHWGYRIPGAEKASLPQSDGHRKRQQRHCQRRASWDGADASRPSDGGGAPLSVAPLAGAPGGAPADTAVHQICRALSGLARAHGTCRSSTVWAADAANSSRAAHAVAPLASGPNGALADSTVHFACQATSRQMPGISAMCVVQLANTEVCGRQAQGRQKHEKGSHDREKSGALCALSGNDPKWLC